MPYCTTIRPSSGIEIALWHLTEELSELLTLWGDAELPAHFHTAKAEKRRREIVATALLMRHHLGKDVVLQHAPNGAPLIDNGYISISHTSTHVAVATHHTRHIGVDIERMGNRAERVMSRFLSTQEIAALPDEGNMLPCKATHRTAAIHIAWSVKEAVYKVHPTAVEFCEDIILTPLTSLPDGTTTAQLPATGTTLQAHYTLYDGCSLAWVVE